MRLLPRIFSEVISDATRFLGRNWRPLISSSLMVFIPAGIVTLLVFRWTGANEVLELVLNDPASLQNLPPDVLIETAGPFINAAAIALLIQVVASVFVFLISHRVVAADISGHPIDGPQARKFAFAKIVPTFITVALAAIPTTAAFIVGMSVWSGLAAAVGAPSATSAIVGLLLLAVFMGPGLWLVVSFSMVTAVGGLESAGILGSLSRSHRLVKGRRMATLSFLLIVGLLGFVAIELIQLVAIPLASIGTAGPGISVASMIGIAAQGMIVAAIGVTVTTWYLDLRSRSEVLLSEDLS